VRRAVLSLVFVVLSSGSLLAQVATNSPPVRRDQNAVNTVQAAITALGGATAIGQAQSWQIRGQSQVTMPDGTSVSATFTWESNGTDFRIAATSSTSSGYLVSGYGNPAYVVTSPTSSTLQVPWFVSAATFIPTLVGPMLVQQLQNTNCALVFAGPAKLGSESVTVVKTALPTATTTAHPLVIEQTWYFDSGTNLPAKIDFRTPSQQSQRVSFPAAVALSNYQVVSGVLYPFQIIRYVRGKQTRVETVQSANVNVTIASSDFQAPTGGAQ
jgi:hypothetical protein